MISYQGHGQESLPTTVLEKYKAPDIAPELSQKIQSYLDIRAPGLGMLAPNNTDFYFSWKITGTFHVWKLGKPNSFPIQMTGGEDPTQLHEITPDGKFLILSRDRNGQEYPGLYLQSTQGDPLLKVFHKPKVRAFFVAVSDDSQKLYFRANDTDPTSYHFYTYDISNQKTELLFAPKGTWFIADKRPGYFLLGRAITNTAAEYFELNLKTKDLKPIIGQNEEEEYSVLYAYKSDEYFVITNKHSEFRKLYLLSKKEGLKTLPPNLNYDIDGFSTDNQKKYLVLNLNNGGYSQIKLFNARTLKEITLPSFLNYDHVYNGKFSRDGNHLILGMENSKGPRVSFSLNLKAMKLTQWVFPMSPEVNTNSFVRAELDYYPSRDGQKIPMFVRVPEHCKKRNLEKPCPVVVHFHGGPESQSRPGFSVFAQLFIDEGFIYVEPNVRGSDGYGKTWLHSDNGPKRLDVISDIEDASRYIKEKWKINNQEPKVGVFGWSYGGYSTLMAMSRFAGSYDAGVALVGMSNLVTFLNNTAPYRRALRIPEYGDPIKDHEALKLLSPITYLDKIKDPLLIIQGANDPRVPAGESLQIHEMLKRKNIDSKLIIFADEGHGSSKRSNQVLEIGHLLNFMNIQLKKSTNP